MKLLSILTLLPLIVALLSGCSTPGETSCKKAMRQVYADTLVTGKDAHKPKQCNGVDDAVLADYAMEILQEEWEVNSG